MNNKQSSRERRSSNNFFGGNSFEVRSSPSTAQKHDIYLYGEIEDATQFIDAIEVMESAGENDLVVINLSTPGGNVSATDTFIHAMKGCAAKIVVIATGGVHSAGTLILLSADEFQLSDGFHALFHNGSYGSFGKASDVKSHLEFQAAFSELEAHRYYSGFFSSDEIKDMCNGKDFWVDAEEFMRRFEMRNEWMREQEPKDSAEEAIDSDL